MTVFGRALEVVYSTSNVWEGLPYVCAAAGVFAGGIIVWYAFIWLLEYLLLGREHRYFHVRAGWNGKLETWFRPSYRSCRNVVHLVLISLFFAGIVFIVWISASVAGMNPWTSAAATLSLGVVLTYSFAGVLSHLSSAVSMLATNSAGVDQYWEFSGMPEYEGLIYSINKMGVTMIRFVEKEGVHEEIYMPMSFFTNNPRKRNFAKELEALKNERQVQVSLDNYHKEMRVVLDERKEILRQRNERMERKYPRL